MPIACVSTAVAGVRPTTARWVLLGTLLVGWLAAAGTFASALQRGPDPDTPLRHPNNHAVREAIRANPSLPFAAALWDMTALDARDDVTLEQAYERLAQPFEPAETSISGWDRLDSEWNTPILSSAVVRRELSVTRERSNWRTRENALALYEPGRFHSDLDLDPPWDVVSYGRVRSDALWRMPGEHLQLPTRAQIELRLDAEGNFRPPTNRRVDPILHVYLRRDEDGRVFRKRLEVVPRPGRRDYPLGTVPLQAGYQLWLRPAEGAFQSLALHRITTALEDPEPLDDELEVDRRRGPLDRDDPQPFWRGIVYRPAPCFDDLRGWLDGIEWELLYLHAEGFNTVLLGGLHVQLNGEVRETRQVWRDIMARVERLPFPVREQLRVYFPVRGIERGGVGWRVHSEAVTESLIAGNSARVDGVWIPDPASSADKRELVQVSDLLDEANFERDLMIFTADPSVATFMAPLNLTVGLELTTDAVTPRGIEAAVRQMRRASGGSPVVVRFMTVPPPGLLALPDTDAGSLALPPMGSTVPPLARQLLETVNGGATGFVLGDYGPAPSLSSAYHAALRLPHGPWIEPVETFLHDDLPALVGLDLLLDRRARVIDYDPPDEDIASHTWYPLALPRQFGDVEAYLSLWLHIDRGGSGRAPAPLQPRSGGTVRQPHQFAFALEDDLNYPWRGSPLNLYLRMPTGDWDAMNDHIRKETALTLLAQTVARHTLLAGLNGSGGFVRNLEQRYQDTLTDRRQTEFTPVQISLDAQGWQVDSDPPLSALREWRALGVELQALSRRFERVTTFLRMETWPCTWLSVDDTPPVVRDWNAAVDDFWTARGAWLMGRRESTVIARFIDALEELEDRYRRGRWTPSGVVGFHTPTRQGVSVNVSLPPDLLFASDPVFADDHAYGDVSVTNARHLCRFEGAHPGVRNWLRWAARREQAPGTTLSLSVSANAHDSSEPQQWIIALDDLARAGRMTFLGDRVSIALDLPVPFDPPSGHR